MSEALGEPNWMHAPEESAFFMSMLVDGQMEAVWMIVEPEDVIDAVVRRTPRPSVDFRAGMTYRTVDGQRIGLVPFVARVGDVYYQAALNMADSEIIDALKLLAERRTLRVFFVSESTRNVAEILDGGSGETMHRLASDILDHATEASWTPEAFAAAKMQFLAGHALAEKLWATLGTEEST